MGRVFGFLSIVVVLAAGMYIYSKQAQSTSTMVGGNSPKAAVDITAVKSDLLSIAQAERTYYATETKYASLDELVSSRSLAVARQRPGYSYEVQTSSGGFKVVATRTSDDGSGAPAQMSVDENMNFESSQ